MRFPARVLLPLAVLSCSEPTSNTNNPPPPGSQPALPLVVTIAATSVEAPVLSVANDSTPLISCRIHLLATATGSGRIPWGNAVVRFYSGANRATPVDSTIVSVFNVVGSWGRSDMGTTDSLRSTWTVTTPAPYEAVFDYTLGDTHPSVRIACGPKPADVPSTPVVNTVTVTPSSGDIKTGDSVTLQATAHSDDGLWALVVAGEGACEFGAVFPGRLNKDLTRTVRLAVPPGCDVDGTVTFTAYAYDAVLHEGSKPGSTLHYVDPVPPGLTAAPSTDQMFLTTDTYSAVLSATDNNAVDSIRWEVEPLGIKGSIAASGTQWSGSATLPVGMEWIGATGIRFTAVDRGGLTSGNVLRPLSIVPGVSRPTVTGALAENPTDMRVDVKRGLAYALFGDRLWIFSLSTGLKVDTLRMPHGGRAFDLSHGGDSLVLAVYSTIENPFSDRRIGFINLLETPRTLRASSLSGLIGVDEDIPADVLALANGKVLVTTFGGRVVEFTPGGTQQIRSDIPSGTVAGLVRSFNGAVALGKLGPDYLRYETGSNQFQVFTATTPDGRSPALDGTGAQAVVGPRLYNGSMSFVREAEYAGTNSANVLSFMSPDGLHMYQVTTYSVASSIHPLLLKNRVSDGKIVAATRLPISFSRFRLSNDGTFLVGFGIGVRFLVVDLR